MKDFVVKDKKNYFRLRIPTFGEMEDRKKQMRELRDKAQSARYDISMIERQIESAIAESEEAILNKEFDALDTVAENRRKIVELTSQSTRIEEELIAEMEGYRFELAARHLVSWNYVDDEKEAIPVPSSYAELISLPISYSTIKKMADKTLKLYDESEDEKND